METRARSASVAVPTVKPDPQTRKRLSGPALRAFFNIAAAWGLSVAEQRGLLGWPAASTYHKYKAGDHGALAFDTLTRLSLILGIYKSLHVLYPEPGIRGRLGAHAEQPSTLRRSTGARNS